MIVYPAIDLRDGRVVQLVGGRPEEERIRLPEDPMDVAHRWSDAGFGALHVVDLDRALGNGSNEAVLARLLRDGPAIPIQVGGGIRTEADAARMLDAGAARVIVGTRAVGDRDWLERVCALHPRRIVVAADVRDGEVVVSGWTAGSGQRADEFIAGLARLPLAGVLVTDVGREGRMGGADLDVFAALIRVSGHPLIASGGIRDESDLHALGRVGAAGAVLGMALYTGAIDAWAIARLFGGRSTENEQLHTRERE